MAISALLIASCGNSGGGGYGGLNSASPVNRVNLTHEDAMMLSGYISCVSNKITGIMTDGTIRGFNGGAYVSDGQFIQTSAAVELTAKIFAVR